MKAAFYFSATQKQTIMEDCERWGECYNISLINGMEYTEVVTKLQDSDDVPLFDDSVLVCVLENLKPCPYPLSNHADIDGLWE